MRQKFREPLAVPTIHINGTARDDLLDAIREAARALREAEHAVGKCAPHGRDYYPKGSASLTIALHQHSERVRKLREIARDLEEIGEHIVDAEVALKR